MRKGLGKDVEDCRIVSGPMASKRGSGPCGAFKINGFKGSLALLTVIASDGRDWKECGFEEPVWEHVSVSLQVRTPSWEEMTYIKRLFWYDHELVIQMHVPLKDHINYHTNCLHLWKPVGIELPVPPSGTVAPSKSR